LLVVNPGVPARSVPELIQVARARPDALNFGSGGAGTIAYPAGEMFKMITGVNMRHIPYKGTILALNDLIAGQVHVVFSDMPIALPHTNTGKVRALAVTSAKRTPLLPNMPTVAEGGVPGYAIENSWGLFAPRSVPPAIVAKLNAEVVRIHELRDVRDRYALLGLEAVTSTPEKFAEYIRTEAAKYSKIIKATGAKVD
jgi:tripartite-type tricarboxylate transporter receptor subunit TctC